MSIPLEKTISDFRTHRFDCDPDKGVAYYLDDKLLHTDSHNIPRNGGSLQLKLWADGNNYWSGLPSKSDVQMQVKSVIAYFNTTSSLSNEEWNNKCAREQKQCKAVWPGAPMSDDNTPKTTLSVTASSVTATILPTPIQSGTTPHNPVHSETGTRKNIATCQSANMLMAVLAFAMLMQFN